MTPLLLSSIPTQTLCETGETNMVQGEKRSIARADRTIEENVTIQRSLDRAVAVLVGDAEKSMHSGSVKLVEDLGRNRMLLPASDSGKRLRLRSNAAISSIRHGVSTAASGMPISAAGRNVMVVFSLDCLCLRRGRNAPAAVSGGMSD